MKKILVTMVLAATGVAASAQTTFLQDGKGESAYKLFGSAFSVNTSAKSLSGSIDALNRSARSPNHFYRWGINFDIAATDGVSPLKTEDGFLFNGGFGFFFARKETAPVVGTSSASANEWYISGKVLSERNKLYDLSKTTGQVFDQGNAGWKFATGLTGYKDDLIYGVELNFGQATNAKDLSQQTISTLQPGSTDSVKIFKEQAAFNRNSFIGSQFNVQVNADIGYALFAQPAAAGAGTPMLFAVFHFRYKTFELSKPQFNPAIGLYVASPGKGRAISAGFNVQESDIFNVLDAKESSFNKRLTINFTAGYNF